MRWVARIATAKFTIAAPEMEVDPGQSDIETESRQSVHVEQVSAELVRRRFVSVEHDDAADRHGHSYGASRNVSNSVDGAGSPNDLLTMAQQPSLD